MKLWVCTAVAVLGLVASDAAFGYSIRDGHGFVIANGGNSAVAAVNASYQLYGTVGQFAVGKSQVVGWRLCSGLWCFGGSRVLPVDPERPIPTEFALGPPSPNPTRDQVRFHLALPKAATVTLAIYDIGGRQIGDEVSQSLAAGEHELFCRPPGAKAGVYYLRLSTDGQLRAKRMIVLVK